MFFKRFYREVYDQLGECHRPKSVEISSFYVKVKWSLSNTGKPEHKTKAK